MILLTAQEMQVVDAFAIERMGIPSRLLMENAGRKTAEVICEHFGQAIQKGVLVVCGPGNNGGDGFVAARYLSQAGVPVQIACLCSKTVYKADSLANLELIQDLPVVFCTSEEELPQLHQMLKECGLVVDAVFGTGLKREVKGLVAQAVLAINEANRPVVAVDIPSGLSADCGIPLGRAVKASLTVTMQYAKLGHFLAQGPEFCGRLHVVNIGIPKEALQVISSRHSCITFETFQSMLKLRLMTGHKGTFGHVLMLAGSRGKYGAGLLACRGALRAGAGLVTLACSAEMQHVLVQSLPEVMSIQLEEDLETRQAWQLVFQATLKKKAVGIGPGFGLSQGRTQLMQQMIAELELPLVVDADALSAVAEAPSCLAEARGPRILTPHEGEMARLTGMAVSEIWANRAETAREFARKNACYVVLKGPGTVIAAPNGQVAVNSTGNAGMAAGGMGDVLTGILTGLLAQGYGPWEACILGVFAHGAAGDRLCAHKGPFGFFATELADELLGIWQRAAFNHASLFPTKMMQKELENADDFDGFQGI